MMNLIEGCDNGAVGEAQASDTVVRYGSWHRRFPSLL